MIPLRVRNAPPPLLGLLPGEVPVGVASIEPDAPLPRAWRPSVERSESFGQRIWSAFQRYAPAVGGVLLGVSAVPAGAEIVRGADRVAAPLEVDAAAVETAREVLFGGGARAVAAGSHDVGATSADELRTLERSQDPKARRLAATIKNARSAYADLLASGARLVVSAPAANGGQPALLIVPAGFDHAKPARVHTHYHGWNSTVAEPIGHSAGAGSRIRALQARDPQLVFVLPECANAPAQRGSYATDWSNVVSERGTTDAALASFGLTDVAHRTVSAHSGGGAAIQRAIQRTPDGSGLRADRLELLDSLYGSEAAVAAWGSTANGKAASAVVYLRGTNNAGRDAPIAAAFGARYAKIDMATKGPITEAENPTLRDARGRVIGRTFSPDAHNRTVGAFMGGP